MYLATRSERAGAPVLIWPQPCATARSAIVVSSVSPDRCDMTDVYDARVARRSVSRVSVSVPIWLTLIRMALATPALDAPGQALLVGDEDVVADELDAPAQRRRVRSAQPSQSSSAMPSSIERIGYRSARSTR